MSISRDFRLNKTFHSEQEKKRFFYKLRSGKVDKCKTRNDLLDKKTGKIYRKKRKKKVKKFIFNYKHFQSKEYRLLTGCEKLHRTIKNNIDLVHNDLIINAKFSVSVNRSTVEYQRWNVDFLTKETLGKSYYKRKNFQLDNQIKKQIVLEYLYKLIHIVSLKSVLEGREIVESKLKYLKIKNNRKNNILFEKFIDKYKKLKIYYEKNNLFFYSFWDVPYGPSFYEGL